VFGAGAHLWDEAAAGGGSTTPIGSSAPVL
jgi:hypothetical protein